ncbi:MAG: hypothetical protein ABJM06_12480 [Gilvibacter sp.]
MKEFKKLIYTASLKNNCPECFSSDGITLEFRQLGRSNLWFSAYTEELESTMECDKCKSIIYPISWDDDIERVYDYHKKSTQLEPTKKRWKLSAKILIALLILGAIAAGYFGYTYYK